MISSRIFFGPTLRTRIKKKEPLTMSPIPHTQSWFLKKSLSPDAVAHYSLPAQPPAVLYSFLDGLRRAIMRIEEKWNYLHQPPVGTNTSILPCKNKRVTDPVRSYVLYATAVKALMNWPQGFYDFLDAYIRRDDRFPELVEKELIW